MISHRILLGSLVLGALQGALPGLYLADHLDIDGFFKFCLFVIGYVLGIILGFYEIEMIKRLLFGKPK